MSDIVERLTANLDKYPGFQNMNSEAAAEITRLRDELAAWKAEGEIAREYNKLRNVKRGTGVLSDWQKRLSKARAATDAIEKEKP